MKHETLHEARMRRGIDSVGALANLAGVSKATVSRIETGAITNPSSATVAKLENALRLRRGSLVFGVPRERAA